ncbi:pro-neuregulin-1, membrane-bound isoform isoform X2 [Clupea harengus]|uniref:Pro-neuregulin-1, membrane-bound isoform n=1 Tax=Clupea harengus TaxID=7950 RepID=A0A6P8GEU5_CLUHA|nr:pro-neuregulin-1, membrane-bound isoform isoform X2 [Clupea harengus]
MQAHVSMARNYFTRSVFYVCFAYLSLHPQGALCSSLTCNPSSPRLESVQELVHRSGVVVEGKLQDDGQESDINAQRNAAKVNKSTTEMMNDLIDEVQEPVPNRTSDLKPHHVRVRVHQVWEIKAGGLAKDSIVSLLWYSGDNCFTLSADTRYIFFMESTNDTSVFTAAFPPVEIKRAVRKDVSKVLCQSCAEPKLKQMRSKTVDVGKKTAMTCELEAGNPLPKIKWYKDGTEITGKSKPKNTKIKKKKQGRISELQFKRPTESDTATYTCEAVNNLGKFGTSGNLTVIKAATSTTPSVRTSSHVTPCSESEKAYCVNGGDCFTLEVTAGTTKKLCRCPNEFTGDRCQTYVMASFYTEELYQKRVLTITGICIALLVVGIMCVVAYCKTKKQRQKFHDRLRQSLRQRNAMATMANGPHTHPPHPPPENIQLVNQYISKSAPPAKHVIEKETSFSPSQYTSSAHQATTVTHTSSQSWMNSKHENIVSESRSALVMSSVEGSRQGTPSHRGRLNATGGTRDLGARDLAAYLKSTRDTPDSSRDSPYSERYVSAMTSPTHLSHVELLTPVTPGSPPSEMSAPLSSLATSVPSVAVSPSVDEDRPLLFLTPPRLRDKQRPGCGGSSGGRGGGGGHGHNHVSGVAGAHQCSKRNSAHYNHGQDPTPPPSPLHIDEDEYESTQECEVAIAMTPTAPMAAVVTRPPSPVFSKKVPGSHHRRRRHCHQKNKAQRHCRGC